MTIVAVTVTVAAVDFTAIVFGGIAFSVGLTPVLPGQRVRIRGEVLFQGRRINVQLY